MIDSLKSQLLSIQNCLNEEWPLKPCLVNLIKYLIKETNGLAPGLNALCLFIHELIHEHCDLIIQLVAHILQCLSTQSTESPQLSIALIFILKKASDTHKVEYSE